jgi:two-component system cell cycle response regulator CpdR
LKILVAEDEPSILNLYKIVLELNGNEVYLSKDGEECLDIFQKHSKSLTPSDARRTPFDIVLLDYRMPKKDGLLAATEILSICPRQKIIMVSAFASEIINGLTKALKNSIKVLEKPIEFENLPRILENERDAALTRNPGVTPEKQLPSTLPGTWMNDDVREEMR